MHRSKYRRHIRGPAKDVGMCKGGGESKVGGADGLGGAMAGRLVGFGADGRTMYHGLKQQRLQVQRSTELTEA
eukprot:7850107-Alexandrium_andersonii.AAC.1